MILIFFFFFVKILFLFLSLSFFFGFWLINVEILMYGLCIWILGIWDFFSLFLLRLNAGYISS